MPNADDIWTYIHQAEQTDTTWMNQANCLGANTETFYPPRGADCTPIRAICHNCPVQTQCLEYSIANHITDGWWGGRSARDRKRLITARNRATGRSPRRSADLDTADDAA